MDPARCALIPSTTSCYAAGAWSAKLCRAAGETATEGVPPVGPVLPLSFKGSQSLISPSEVKMEPLRLYARPSKTQRFQTKRQMTARTTPTSNCRGGGRTLHWVWRPAATRPTEPPQSRPRLLLPMSGTTKLKPRGAVLYLLPTKLQWLH